MELYSEESISGQSLDHLGLISDKITDLELIKLIDTHLPLSSCSGSKVSMGERVAAMILNGLGFVDTRLYMFPEFLQKKPVTRLFGKKLESSWFNDDALGRCLDAISEYGTTKLFTLLSFEIGCKKGLLGKSAHFDTTTLQLSGDFFDCNSSDYDISSGKKSVPIPAQGYSKSKRHDLKQMVLNLATTGKANFPIWMESHSGNASDKKILPEAAHRMHELCSQLKDVEDFIYVGDSSLYSNVLPLSSDMKWLSRVPENIKEAKQLISNPKNKYTWHDLPEGYSYTVINSNYGDVAQRWLMIFSEQSYNRTVKTLERNIDKSKKDLTKDLKSLSAKHFSCIKDGELAVKHLLKKKNKYHKIDYEFEELTGYKNAGRPKKDAKAEHLGYKLNYKIIEDAEKISLAKIKKGRFILATNELDKSVLADNKILAEYKAQSGTESGFKFIKDDTFELDSVYLKTPSRIDALMMIMTLCLMVYGVSQYDLRQALKFKNKTLPDQRRKPTQKPSIKWIFFLFSGVHELTINMGEQTKQLVINVNPLLKEIISYLGPRAKEIYLNSS